MNDLLLRLPELSADVAGLPYVHEYRDLWAIEDSHLHALVRQAEFLNVNVHLEQHAPQAAARAESECSSGLAITEDGIAVIQLRGTLMKQVSSFSAGTSTVMARRQVRAAMAADDVRGVLFVIDSPGGTVAGTADLGDDIRALNSKKPTSAFIDDLGASGAYWPASQTARISANRTALVGSIGVYTVVYDLSKQATKEGIQVHVVRFGAFKGAGEPGTKITDEHLAYLQERIDGMAGHFVDAIAAGRKLPRERALALADGRMHLGEQAREVGLIDAVESIDEAMAHLVAATKTNPRTRTQIMSTQADVTPVASEPKTATIAELKEACPGASKEFILDQLEAGATVHQAMKAHAKQLAADNVALAKERDTLKEDAAKAETEKVKADAKTQAATTAESASRGSKPRRGNEPLGGGD